MQHASSRNNKRHNNRSTVVTRTAFAAVLLAGALPAAAQLSLQQALMLRAHGAVITAQADSTVSAAPLTTEAALHELADQASVIFTGQVLAIRNEGGAMAVDFRVDDGIRGVLSGDTYTVREWSGLWSGNADRMRVGQRALFLFHAPSAGGFSSPVGGADGIVPLSGDNISAAVDLRWIAARVARTVGTRPDNAPDETIASNAVYASRMAAVAATPARQASAAANGIAWPADATAGNVLGPDLHRIDKSLVTGLLRAWAASETVAAR